MRKPPGRQMDDDESAQAAMSCVCVRSVWTPLKRTPCGALRKNKFRSKPLRNPCLADGAATVRPESLRLRGNYLNIY